MNQQLQCTLLHHLPPELRQQIYTYALISDEPLTDLTLLDNTCPKPNRTPLLGLALPQTCHFIHNEFDIRLFYTTNTFTFTHPNTAFNFFEHLQRTKHLHLPRSISFDLRHTITQDPQTNAEQLAYRRASLWMDWDHYLTCSVPSSSTSREFTNPARRRYDSDTTCGLYDDMHLTEHIPQLTGLESLVLDCVGLQVDIYERTENKGHDDLLLKVPLRFLRTLANSCASLVLSTFVSLISTRGKEGAAKGPETTMRMLNRDLGIVHIGLVPERPGGVSPSLLAWDEECLRVRERRKEAVMRELVERRSFLYELHGNSAVNCEG